MADKMLLMRQPSAAKPECERGTGMLTRHPNDGKNEPMPARQGRKVGALRVGDGSELAKQAKIILIGLGHASTNKGKSEEAMIQFVQPLASPQRQFFRRLDGE